MAKDKHCDERLSDQIRLLELKRKEELESLKYTLHELRNQLTPSHIIRNTFHSITENPSQRNKFLYGVAQIAATAFLQRFVSKKNVPLGKILLLFLPHSTKLKKQS